ncbi:NADH-quinone oxidoreductase subunit C [Pelistega europaea]|uniref:NADH-quinone oxidoreductase subunit C n=1 Tax=Pelistega europaea TaxID=106147 RepID=A0A7Y4LB37_9BURK|nr:NADH-quinone oxidoreductase subunit C [Pelistega europaea]NOL50213.1 NADH-quinone oxidoreductase subunit C [Pelistega europaea]
MTRLQTLEKTLLERLGDTFPMVVKHGEITLEIPADQWVKVCTNLRDEPLLGFDIAVDLAGIDYSTYGLPGKGPATPFPARFAAVVHLLSTKHNWRLRVRAFAPDDAMPILPTLVNVWPSLGWFEREAFDMFGIIFEGHPDLRRILTDYGFIGHPFRKDFPLSGYVEMRYDEQSQRVVYQPVTIEPREITPRVIREEGYGAGR